MADLPAAIQHGRITGTILLGDDDGADAGSLPDRVSPIGTITFTPSVDRLIAQAAGLVVYPRPITVQLDGTNNGQFAVDLIATNTNGVTPTGWTYTVTVVLDSVPNDWSFPLEVPAGSNRTLVQVAPVDDSDGETITKGDMGPGVASITIGPNQTLVFTLTDSSAVTVPLPEGTGSGPAGPKGDDGADGSDGPAGADGPSAYELWLSSGNTGSLSQFLASLVGPTGADGVDGRSAYEVAVDNGFPGTINDWLTSLVGPQGPPGSVDTSAVYTKSEADGRYIRSFQSLIAGTDVLSQHIIVDDGSNTHSWPNREEWFYQDLEDTVPHLVQWINEYGERRYIPAKHNTVGWRLFTKHLATDPVHSGDAWQIVRSRDTMDVIASVDDEGLHAINMPQNMRVTPTAPPNPKPMDVWIDTGGIV